MKKQKFKNPITQKYYHQLYKSFPLHNLHEKEFLKLIKIRLHEYENSHLEATYQDYIERFGLPEDIIIFFYLYQFFRFQSPLPVRPHDNHYPNSFGKHLFHK